MRLTRDLPGRSRSATLAFQAVQAAEPKTRTRRKTAGRSCRSCLTSTSASPSSPRPRSPPTSRRSPPEDRQVLDKLVEAGKLMNEIFLRQAWTGNPADARAAEGATQARTPTAAREYFTINFGPWDRLDERQPFIGDKAASAPARATTRRT